MIVHVNLFWSGVMSSKRKIDDVDWIDTDDFQSKKQYMLLDNSNPTPSAQTILNQQPLATTNLSPTLEVLVKGSSTNINPIIRRGIKRRGEFDIDTVDVNVPIKRSNIVYFDKPTIVKSSRKKFPEYRLHPSMLTNSKIKKTKRKRRRRKRRNITFSKNINSYLRYHPTIQAPSQNFVRYHPSIKNI